MPSLTQKISSALSDLFGGGSGSVFRTALDVPQTENVGLDYLGSVSYGTGGAIDLSGLFNPAKYDAYRMIADNVQSSDTNSIGLQVKDASSGNFINSAYYYSNSYVSSANPTTPAASASITGGGMVIAVKSAANNVAGYGCKAVFDLMNCNLGVAGDATSMMSTWFSHQPSTIYGGTSSSMITTTSGISGAKIVAFSGGASVLSITQGRVRMYGYRKS